jgi:hypothetical protein
MKPGILLLWFVSTFGWIACGQTLYISVTAEQPIGHNYDVHMGTWDDQELSFSVPTNHLAGYSQVQFTVSAPQGCAWHIKPPLTDFPLLGIWLGYGIFTDPHANILSTDTQFTLLGTNTVSPDPGLGTHGFIGQAGDGFAYTGFFDPSGDIVFTGYTTTVRYDNSLVADVPPGIGAHRAFIQLEYGTGFPVDPGQQLFLSPIFDINEPSLGTNGLTFNIAGIIKLVAVVEACTSLAAPTWVPLDTNTLISGSWRFNDPQWANYPRRFYRVRMQ